MAYIKDLGNYVNRNGYKIKEGYIIKSSYLKKRESKKIKAKKVIDMRTRIERLQKPEYFSNNIKQLWIPIFDDATSGITHEKQHRLEQIQNVPTLDIIYRGVVGEEICYSRLGEVIKSIMHSDVYPIMYHCSEGKDRTGIITMLLLSMLDFDVDQIVEDYLIVNKGLIFKSKIYYFLISTLKRDKELAIKTRDFSIAKKEYILGAIDEIKTKFGSVESYIRNQLGITDEEISNFKKKVLEKA